MTQFVFCHGWGFDIRFWDRIAPCFSQEKYPKKGCCTMTQFSFIVGGVMLAFGAASRLVFPKKNTLKKAFAP